MLYIRSIVDCMGSPSSLQFFFSELSTATTRKCSPYFLFIQFLLLDDLIKCYSPKVAFALYQIHDTAPGLQT